MINGVETTVLTILASGTFVQALVSVWANRHKREASTASVLAQNAMAQVDSITKRCDQLEEDVREFKASLFPHQGWDLKAHKAALQTDPNFPAPPELFI